MFKIAICAGHYENHKGVFKNGFHEFDICNNIAQRIKEQVSLSLDLDMEVEVIYGSLADKILQINANPPDIAIEIHLGNSNNPKVNGTRSFFMINNSESKLLADSLVSACTQALETESKGSWVGWYKKIGPKLVKAGKAPVNWKPKIDLFLSKLKCPSAIIEPFFLSSLFDVNCYTNDENYEIIADAIINGIRNYQNCLTS